MRLYLSSFRLGDHTDRLTALAPPPGPALVINNAIDFVDPQTRATRAREELQRLRSLGYDCEELDLAEHLDDPSGLPELLAGAALLWLRGGNVFVLRHLLAATGADRLIIDLLRRDAVAYGGYSAGVCVLGPHLRRLDSCDDPDQLRDTYGVEPRFDGLGLLDRVVVPHLDSPDHFECAALARIAAEHEAAGEAHLDLRDGDVWLVEPGNGHGELLPRRR